MELLIRVERYLRDSKTSPSTFGRAVAHDPRLVHDMRRGRQIKSPGLRGAIEARLGDRR